MLAVEHPPRQPLPAGVTRHISYEDPQYAEADIVDSTAPSWLKDHPNGPRAAVMSGVPRVFPTILQKKQIVGGEALFDQFPK